MRRTPNRFRPDVMRHYGYFFSGLSPPYWWWEILVKRADAVLLMGITYTNIVPDERAKLLWYAFVSGAMLALHNQCKPYDKRQCGIVDTAETFALAVRFTNFVIPAPATHSI